MPRRGPGRGHVTFTGVADNITHYDAVEGYCDRLSYLTGDTVRLATRCTSARYDVSVQRWGATQKSDAPVWTATGLQGAVPATPSDADANGACWPVSVEIPIAESWPSGFYLVTLTAHDAPDDRRTGHACFVVRAAASDRTNRALFVLATNSWNAYNNWGGKSLYTGGVQVSFRRPFGRGLLWRAPAQPDERDDRKAWPFRSGEPADPDGQRYQEWRWANGYAGFAGSNGWYTYERRFAEWAESNGYTLDYAVSSDLETVPDLLDGYDLVIGAGHDEYWSAGGRNAVEAYVRSGGTYASFSGNTMFWQVRLTENADHMICHKYTAHETDPAAAEGRSHELTSMWADQAVANPEWRFLGAGSAYGLYARFGQAVPRGAGAFTVYRCDHWLFAETGLHYGDLLGAHDGIVGYETVGCRLAFDDLNLPIAKGGDGTPELTEIVAWAPASNLGAGEYPKSVSAPADQCDAEFVAKRVFGELNERNLALARHGNAVMLTTRPFGPEAGEVITIGSTDWVFGLAHDPAVAQVTRNVLDRRGSPANST